MSQLRVFSGVLILGAVLATLATTDPVFAMHDNRPHVRILPTDLLAQEVGPDPGVATVQRTGRVDYPLGVRIRVEGTAALGGVAPDFHITLAPSRRPREFLLTIPTGSAQATIRARSTSRR